VRTRFMRADGREAKSKGEEKSSNLMELLFLAFGWTTNLFCILMCEFWGLVLVPGKKFTPDEPMPVRVTQISFGEKVIKGSRTCVFVRKDAKDFAICTLLEGIAETMTVDIRLPEDNEFSIYTTGPNEVHLTGEVLSSSFDSDEENDYLSQLVDSIDSEEESDGELEPARIEEIKPAIVQKLLNGIQTPHNGTPKQNNKRKCEQKENGSSINKHQKGNKTEDKLSSITTPKHQKSKTPEKPQSVPTVKTDAALTYDKSNTNKTAEPKENLVPKIEPPKPVNGASNVAAIPLTKSQRKALKKKLIKEATVAAATSTANLI